MKTCSGYTGKILDVDLTSAILSKAELDPCLANDYMGGKGFGAKILYDQLPPRCEPLSSDNILVFATGPLTGTLAPSSGRFEVCTKSPATGLWLDSNCGGYFGPELKFAGYDMLIIRGKAAKPTLLVIEDNQYELKPAGELWGLDTISTHRQIKDALGKDCKVACIGCGICVKKCPSKAIELKYNLATIDQTKCIKSQECFKACPTKCIITLS